MSGSGSGSVRVRVPRTVELWALFVVLSGCVFVGLLLHTHYCPHNTQTPAQTLTQTQTQHTTQTQNQQQLTTASLGSASAPLSLSAPCHEYLKSLGTSNNNKRHQQQTQRNTCLQSMGITPATDTTTDTDTDTDKPNTSQHKDEQTALESTSASSSSPLSPDVSYFSSVGVSRLFSEYVSLHRSILSGSCSGSSCGVIVCRFSGTQLNNRLRTIVSALVLGMLTKRAVLAEFAEGYYANINDLFDMPLQIDARAAQARAQGSSAQIGLSQLDNLLCNDLNQVYGNAQVLRMDMVPSLLPYLWRHVVHGPTLARWFGSEEHIYGTVAHYFLQPNKYIQEQIQQFKQEHIQGTGTGTGTNKPYTVGVHIRWGGDMRPLPVPEQEWKDMVTCIEAVIPRWVVAASTPVVVYVASDTGESRDLIRTHLTPRFAAGSGSSLSGGRLVFYLSEWSRSNNVAGVQQAFVELLLLTHMDQLVLTPGSSYGEQAMALAGKPAYYVRSEHPEGPQIGYNTQHMHTVAHNCLRTHTSQPSVRHFAKEIQQAKCYNHDMHTIHM